MKMLIVATALFAALSAPVSAEEQASCEQIASIANSIMTAHQNGTPLAVMMGITKGNELLQTITVEAYEGVRYSTKQIQDGQIAEFRDRWYMWCFKDKKS